MSAGPPLVRAAWPACSDLDATLERPASTVQPSPAHAAYSTTRNVSGGQAGIDIVAINQPAEVA